MTNEEMDVFRKTALEYFHNQINSAHVGLQAKEHAATTILQNCYYTFDPVPIGDVDESKS